MLKTVLDQEIDKEVIEKECFTLYMKEMVRNYITAIFVGRPLFYFLFQSQVQTSLNVLNIWFTLDIILMVSALISYYCFYKHNDIFHFSTWKKISNIPLIFFSVPLALAPWLFLQSVADIYLHTMFILIISITLTMIHSLGYCFEKMVLFSALPLLSLTIKFTTMESENFFEILFALIFVWIALIVFSHRIHKSLISSIVLKFEHIQARANAERINAEKSQFIAAASHDIRQPLQAVNLLVSTLKSGNKNPHNNALFERLENSVDSMSELLNSLLNVSKLDAQAIVPESQHLCLASLLKKLQSELKPFASAKGIDLVIKATNHTVLADVILLEQVLNNLLSNAIRYTNSGNITVSAESDSGQIKISVKDTGVGIASADQEIIFLEFHQLHNPERDQKKGIGLGLSIVKRLCALQDWPLSLESEQGIGSCFSFNVPKGNSELIQKPETVDMSKNLGAIDVIIIDDHEGIRFSLANILSNWECKVRSFESADHACEALKELPTWKPNLIISDYRLRNNLTGIEAVKQVQAELNYSIEAIIISGDTDPERLKEVERSGLIMLHKPIKPAKLRVIVSLKMKSIIEANIERTV